MILVMILYFVRVLFLVGVNPTYFLLSKTNKVPLELCKSVGSENIVFNLLIAIFRFFSDRNWCAIQKNRGINVETVECYLLIGMIRVVLLNSQLFWKSLIMILLFNFEYLLMIESPIVRNQCSEF